jgi:hypothetical protein
LDGAISYPSRADPTVQSDIDGRGLVTDSASTRSDPPSGLRRTNAAAMMHGDTRYSVVDVTGLRRAARLIDGPSVW